MLNLKRLYCASTSLTAALLLSGIFTSSALATPAEDAYDQGIELLDQKDYRGAIIFLNKAMNLDPALAPGIFAARSSAYEKLGQQQSGVARYDSNLHSLTGRLSWHSKSGIDCCLPARLLTDLLKAPQAVTSGVSCCPDKTLCRECFKTSANNCPVE